MATYADLRTELIDLIDATGDPVLTSDQIDRALMRGRIPDAAGWAPDDFVNWEPNKVYPAGASIVPPARDGYYYTTDAGGTSGAVAPVFDVTGAIDNTVIWRRAGAAYWAGTYDLDRAAAYGWRTKQGIAAKRKNISALGQSKNSSEVFDHCRQMAEYYAGRITGSVRLTGALRRSVY